MRLTPLVAAALAALTLALATADAALAKGMPPPPRAPAEVVEWARGWRRCAIRATRQLDRVAYCLDWRRPGAVAKAPPRAEQKSVWMEAAKEWRALARERWALAAKGRARIFDRTPPGGAVSRWRPLVRWYWPRAQVERALVVIRRESGGRPGAVNRYSGAAGLFQLHPGRGAFLDPVVNVRTAYRGKYLPALRCWGDGWRPWAATAY